MIHTLIAHYKNHQARKRLAQIVEQTRSSERIVQYRQRRAAALKGIALKRQREESLG